MSNVSEVWSLEHAPMEAEKCVCAPVMPFKTDRMSLRC